MKEMALIEVHAPDLSMTLQLFFPPLYVSRQYLSCLNLSSLTNFYPFLLPITGHQKLDKRVESEETPRAFGGKERKCDATPPALAIQPSARPSSQSHSAPSTCFSQSNQFHSSLRPSRFGRPPMFSFLSSKGQPDFPCMILVHSGAIFSEAQKSF